MISRARSNSEVVMKFTQIHSSTARPRPYDPRDMPSTAVFRAPSPPSPHRWGGIRGSWREDLVVFSWHTWHTWGIKPLGTWWINWIMMVYSWDIYIYMDIWYMMIYEFPMNDSFKLMFWTGDENKGTYYCWFRLVSIVDVGVQGEIKWVAVCGSGIHREWTDQHIMCILVGGFNPSAKY